MSNGDKPLDLERSAFLVNLKQEIDRLESRVEELEEEKEGTTLKEDLRSVVEQNADIVSVGFEGMDDDRIIFNLSDNRVVSVPTEWSWRLDSATMEDRRNYQIVDDGCRVVWPDVEEAITVHGILTGEPAPRPDNPDEKETKQENH